MNPTQPFTGEENKIKIFSLTSGYNIQFYAFLTSFSDEYSSNWNNTEVYGRMDPIYTFKNTVRKISIAFDVPSFNLQEAKDNLLKSKQLSESLYPIYETTNEKGASIISSPPLFRIKFSNFMEKSTDSTDGILGWINGYSFKPETDSGFLVESGKLYPKLYKVNFTYNVIHEIPLGFSREIEKGSPTGNLKPRNKVQESKKGK